MTVRRARATAAALVVACAGLAVWASAASATFHLMLVREVYPGSVAHPDAEYVELQMWAPGQNFVGGHLLLTYGSGGNPTEDFLASDVLGDASQSTILIATPEAAKQLGVTADETLSPAGKLDPAGGAVCWESIDCVSWGSFSGTLPSPAGSPAVPGGIPDGMALRRTIAPNCATLLEAADDRDSSGLDFSPAFPSPRPNSVPPSEHACSSSAPGAGNPPGGSAGTPQTRITRHPGKLTHDRTPTFRFASSRSGATFLCKLDRRRFRPCRSPFTTRRLRPGRHVFAVQARAPDGALDPTPARYRFRVS